MTAVALAVTGVAARAMAVESKGASTDAFTVTEVAPPATDAPAAPTATADLPPVQIVPLPANEASAPAAPQQSLSQTLVVVINGGSMSVSPASATVVLHRTEGNHLVGTFGPIVVTDARGSLAGWTLKAALTSPLDGKVAISPDKAVAVTGRPGEATSAKASPLSSDGTAIATAARGGGGGKFSVSGTIDLSGASSDLDQATVGLTFGVA